MRKIQTTSANGKYSERGMQLLAENTKKMVQEKMQDKLWQVESEFRKISDVFEDVKSKLIEDFNIEEDEY